MSLFSNNRVPLGAKKTDPILLDDKCNDLFSRFEQQILFLEKQAEATDPTTIRHGHDGPSQGLVSKHLEKLKIGY